MLLLLQGASLLADYPLQFPRIVPARKIEDELEIILLACWHIYGEMEDVSN